MSIIKKYTEGQMIKVPISIVGGTIGLVTGTSIAAYKNKSYVAYSFIGAISGMIIFYGLSKIGNKKEKQTKI